MKLELELELTTCNKQASECVPISGIQQSWGMEGKASQGGNDTEEHSWNKAEQSRVEET